MEEQSCGSYSTQRRRVRQAVTDSWLQILSINTSKKPESCLEGQYRESMSFSNFPLCEYPEDMQQFAGASSTSCRSESSSDRPDLGCEAYDDASNITDSDSETDMEDNINADAAIEEMIGEWAVKHNITFRALGDLLTILQPYHPGLPKDPRTLLATPVNYKIRQMEENDGQYYHFGVADGIQSILLSGSITLSAELLLQFNVDGLPLFKSSAVELWPILCLLINARCEPFMVGLYCGKKKPASLEDYLNDFLEELQLILKTGLEVGGRHYTIKLQCFVCDAPARAFIKNIKGHSGYFGCDKCTQEGDYLNNRMTFPRVDAPLRTDDQFKAHEQDEHHRGVTPLNILDFGLVTGFALDYMHLVCLGVMRKLLQFWLNGPITRDSSVASRLPSASVERLTAKLVNLRNCMPREFARKPRSLTELDRWKATEFRSFLLYLGPVVLAGVLPDAVYSHFMILSSAISLLASPEFCIELNDYANELLKTFVAQAKNLYGSEFIVYNVHALVHLAGDVKRFGPLDSFSAFPFENQLQGVKRLIRKGAMPLSQIVRRITEKRRFNLYGSSPMQIADDCAYAEHYSGPLPGGCETASQFKCLRTPRLFVSLRNSDNCITIPGIGPAVVCNILKISDDFHLVCQAFRRSSDLYDYPFSSTSIGCVRVLDPCNNYTIHKFDHSVRKCVRLPLDGNKSEQYAVFPVLHTCSVQMECI